MKSKQSKNLEVPMSSLYASFLAVTMLFPMGVVAADGPALSTQQQEVMEVSEALRDAFNHRDLEAFAHHVADDFIASTDEGELLTKTAFIQYLSVRSSKGCPENRCARFSDTCRRRCGHCELPAYLTQYLGRHNDCVPSAQNRVFQEN